MLRNLRQDRHADTKILCLFLGRRIYYSDLPVTFDTHELTAVMKTPPGSVGDASGLAGAGVTHLLMHGDLFRRWLHDNYSPAQIRKFQEFSDRHLEQIRTYKGYRLFALNP